MANPGHIPEESEQAGAPSSTLFSSSPSTTGAYIQS